MTDKQRYQMERWKLLIEDDTRNEMKRLVKTSRYN